MGAPGGQRAGSVVVALAVLLGTTACGGTTTTGQATAGPAGRYEATGLVLQEAGDEPQLCLAGVAASDPPQCEGTPLDGWDWDTVPEGSATSLGGTTYGSYRLEVAVEGERLRLLAPAREPAKTTVGTTAGPTPDVDDVSPCPEPRDGWQVVDDSRITEEDLGAAAAIARREPGISAVWVYRNEQGAARTVLVARTTADPAALEQRLRTSWGGGLCVARGGRPEAELREVEKAATETLQQLLWSGVDVRRGVVEVGVVVATPELQASMDERFGAGVVEVSGALRPAD